MVVGVGVVVVVVVGVGVVVVVVLISEVQLLLLMFAAGQTLVYAACSLTPQNASRCSTRHEGMLTTCYCNEDLCNGQYRRPFSTSCIQTMRPTDAHYTHSIALIFAIVPPSVRTSHSGPWTHNESSYKFQLWSQYPLLFVTDIFVFGKRRSKSQGFAEFSNRRGIIADKEATANIL